MGGFIGGAGAALGQMHENQINRIEQNKRSFAEIVGHQADLMTNPEAKGQLQGLVGQILTSPPGKALDKLHQGYSEILTSIHTAQGGGNGQIPSIPSKNAIPSVGLPPSIQAARAAAAPGQDPAALAPLMGTPVNQQALASPPSGAGIPGFDSSSGQVPYGGAAQPTTSPVQGGGMSSSNAPFRGSTSQPVAQPSDGNGTSDQASSQPNIQPVQPAAMTAAGIPVAPGADPRQYIKDIFGLYEAQKRTMSQADQYMISTLAGQEQPAIGQQALSGGDLQRKLQDIEKVAPGKIQFLKPYIDAMQQDPSMGNYMQLSAAESALGGGSGGGMSMGPWITAMFAKPIIEQLDATSMSPEQKALYGLSADAAGKITIERNRMTKDIERAYPGWAGVQHTLAPNGQMGLMSTNDALKQGGVLEAPGGQPSINSSFAPRTTRGSMHSIKTRADDGSEVTVWMPNPPVTSQKGTGGAYVAPGNGSPGNTPAPAPLKGGQSQPRIQPVPGAGNQADPNAPQVSNAPPGSRIFPVALNPAQFQKADASQRQFAIATDRVKFLRDNVDELKSMIDSKMIDFQQDTGGFLHSFVARNMPLTKKQEEIAAAFHIMGEDINLIRTPLGGQGFRGPEAFKALQSQRGTLMGRPGVTEKILEGTLKTMTAQRGAILHSMYGNNVPPEVQNYTGGSSSGNDDKINVQIPGRQPSWIHRSQLENFKRDFPSMKVLNGQQ